MYHDRSTENFLNLAEVRLKTNLTQTRESFAYAMDACGTFQ